MEISKENQLYLSANPGMINNRAAKAIIAPDIIS